MMMMTTTILLYFFDRLDFDKPVVFGSHFVVFVAFAMMAGCRIGHSTVLLAKLTTCAVFMVVVTVMVVVVVTMRFMFFAIFVNTMGRPLFKPIVGTPFVELLMGFLKRLLFVVQGPRFSHELDQSPHLSFGKRRVAIVQQDVRLAQYDVMEFVRLWVKQ